MFYFDDQNSSKLRLSKGAKIALIVMICVLVCTTFTGVGLVGFTYRDEALAKAEEALSQINSYKGFDKFNAELQELISDKNVKPPLIPTTVVPANTTVSKTSTPVIGPDNAGYCPVGEYMNAPYNKVRPPFQIVPGKTWCVGAPWNYFQVLFGVDLNLDAYVRDLAAKAIQQKVYPNDSAAASAIREAINLALSDYKGEKYGIITWPSVAQVKNVQKTDLDELLPKAQDPINNWDPPVKVPTPKPDAATANAANASPSPTTGPVLMTPYATFTPTPDTYPTTSAGGSDELKLLPAVDIMDLTMKTGNGADIWSLPGVDSVEIYQGYAWAPSRATAQYYFPFDIYGLFEQAIQAGCSKFENQGNIFIYEYQVSKEVSFVDYDRGGLAKYMFPAARVSVYWCYVFDTPTPLPTNVPNEPTATAQQLSGCNVTIPWNDLITDPGQVTGSGNSYLVKWSTYNNNDTYVGDVTGSVFYCITGRPTSFDEKTWNQQTIGLTGPQYGGQNYEYNIPGTTIWVSMIQ